MAAPVTRYANIPRNEAILVLYHQHIEPKRIRAILLLQYPGITVKIVYNAIEKFYAELNGEIRGKSEIAETNQPV